MDNERKIQTNRNGRRDRLVLEYAQCTAVSSPLLTKKYVEKLSPIRTTMDMDRY